MENYIVGNARAHEERQFRLQLVEAYRETNDDEKQKKFDAILEKDTQKDVFKLDSSKQTIKDFAFEPIDFTLSLYMTHLQGVVSPLTHLLKLGEIEFYNSRLEGAIRDGTPTDTRRTWEPLARVSPNCTVSENSCVLYTDKTQSSVDWICTMKNLKGLARTLHYSTDTISKAILRLATWFEGPSIELILRNMTLSQKAQHLMSKTQRSNPYVLLLQALHSLTRFKGQALFNILNESKGIALALYHKEKPDPQKTKVNKLMLHCLLCFTSGTVRATIKQMVDRSTLHQTDLPEWEEISHSAELSETMTSLPDSDLPYKKKTTDSVELFNLRLGGVDHEIPGQFDDSENDHYGFNHHAKKKRFTTYSNPHPGAPTLGNPLGSGPPSDLHRQQPGPAPPAVPPHIPAQPNDDQQRGAMGHLLSVVKPSSSAIGTFGSPTQIRSNSAEAQPNVKIDKQQEKSKKVFHAHEMTTRNSSSTNPAAQHDDDASLNNLDTRQNNYSSRSRRSPPRGYNRRSQSPDRNRDSRRSRDYDPRRSNSRNRYNDASRKNSYSRDSYPRRNSPSPYRRGRSDYRAQGNRNNQYNRTYPSHDLDNQSRNRSTASRRSSRSPGRFQRNSSYNNNNNYQSDRPSSRSRDINRNDRGRTPPRSTSRGSRDVRYGERNYYQTKSGMQKVRSSSYDRGKVKYSSKDSPTNNRGSDPSRQYRSDAYPRRSLSPKNETDLHMIDTLDDPASQVIVKNCFDPLRPGQQMIRNDILSDMVPLMNLT